MSCIATDGERPVYGEPRVVNPGVSKDAGRDPERWLSRLPT